MTDRDPPDFSGPSSSRIYDFSLGGKDNYAADRDAALRAFESLPAARLLPRENRKFMRRSLRYMLDAGIRQFIDVGCGLPGKGNVHEVVHNVDPDAPVVYVDHDPVAVVHYQSLLHAVPSATAIHGDAREPHGILDHPEVTRLIDFTRPVGVLMISILDLILDDEDPEATVRAFRDAMAPGGHLSMSTYVDAVLTPEDRATVEDLMRQVGITVVFRPKERLAAYFEGFELVDPGLVFTPDWRPDRPYDPPSGWLMAAVGRKP